MAGVCSVSNLSVTATQIKLIKPKKKGKREAGEGMAVHNFYNISDK